MKKLFTLISLCASLFASTQVANVNACKKCHPLISAEFTTSMHKKASIYEDKVHKAIWDKHPKKAKNDYVCAKCHTPNVQGKNTKHEGLTCLSCHTIIDVEKHEKTNKNIYSKKDKLFYSAQKGRASTPVSFKLTSTWWGKEKSVGSAYHDIDYTHENFYTGEVCMGCHSHKENGKKFNVCVTDEAGAKSKTQNCITCHMPKVNGSATTVRISKMHAYHGFAGARVSPKMLSKYIKLDFKKQTKGFEIIIDNRAPHALLTHPLRVLQLKTTLKRGDKHIPLKTYTFVKIIGTDGHASFPWLATAVIKDSMIQAKEKRVLPFDTNLEKGDQVEVSLGFYIVNPKLLKKLHLEHDKELAKFILLKSHDFFVK